MIIQDIVKNKIIIRKKIANSKIRNDINNVLKYTVLLNKLSNIKLAPEMELIMEEVEQNDQEFLPRLGNLLSLLEDELKKETIEINNKRMPSQDDITRWALKKAFLEYYQNRGADDIPVVDAKFADRLSTEFAPDFSEIYDIWINKLDELKHRNDKYTLTEYEFDKAISDVSESETGMRGSAVEKQIDRFRIEILPKLWQ